MENEIKKRTKWAYCVGATGRDAAYALVSMYLLTYVQYTMNLTVSQFAVISAAMVVCLLWDAFNDPLMSIIIENSHLKSGKFKPWILIGAVLNAVVIASLFSVRLTGWAYTVFFSVGYLLWGMTYTMNDIAYWGMLPSFSSSISVRNGLVSLMSVFICIGQFAVAGIVPTVVAGNAVNAYRMISIIVALCLILFQTLTVWGVEENPKSENTGEKISLSGMFRIFARNDQLIVIGTATFLFNIGSNLLLMFGVNFFYVEYGYSQAGNLIFIFTVMYGLGMLFSQGLFSTLAKKICRMKMLSFSMVGIIAGYLVFLLIGYILPKNLILLNAAGFIIFFCQGLYLSITVVMLNNTIEYDQWKYHERHDATISAVRSFATKLAGACNQGITALVLIASGIYGVSRNVSNLEIEVGKGELTSSEALRMADGFLASVTKTQGFTLRICMVLIPVLAMVLAYILIKKKYILTEEKYAQICSEI